MPVNAFSRSLRGSLAALALILLILPSCSYGGDRTSPATNDAPAAAAKAPSAAEVSQAKGLAQSLSTAFEAAAAKLEPSVVPIFAEQVVEVQSPFGTPGDNLAPFFGPGFMQRFFGMPQGPTKRTVHSLGSGVIVSPDGYILTNNHVIQGAQKLSVMLNDKKHVSAKVVGADPQTDVALIKIDATDLPAATLGDSDHVEVGQWVIAVGNPFQLMHTVTAGIISAKGRASLGLADYEDFLQTDASINPGNSGGPLADLDGNVIGINTAISSPSGGSVGIGLAIPINMARQVMDQLKAHGKITRGYLGLLPQDIDTGLASALGLSSTHGTLVGDVTPGKPAAKAGIERGDVIVAFDGHEVDDSRALRNLVAQAKPGSRAEVTLLRKGERKTVEVTLGERPNTPESSGPAGESTRPSSHKLGLSVQDLTPQLAQQLGYQNQRGAVVTGVEPGSAAEDAGFQQGDLIQGVNRVPVASADDLERAVADLPAGKPAAFLVRRGKNTFFVSVTIPGP